MIIKCVGVWAYKTALLLKAQTRIEEIFGDASAHDIIDGTTSSLADDGLITIFRFDGIHRIDGTIGVGDEEPASIRRRLGEAVLPYLPIRVADRLKD